jgi:hypothetical protein
MPRCATPSWQHHQSVPLRSSSLLGGAMTRASRVDCAGVILDCLSLSRPLLHVHNTAIRRTRSPARTCANVQGRRPQLPPVGCIVGRTSPRSGHPWSRTREAQRHHHSRGPANRMPTRRSSFRLRAMASPHGMRTGSDCYNNDLYHTRKGHTVGLQRSVLFCPLTAGPPQAPWARRGRWRGARACAGGVPVLLHGLSAILVLLTSRRNVQGLMERTPLMRECADA